MRATFNGVIGCAAAAVAILATATPAGAQAPPAVLGPYDGEIPFACELQNVGTGTDFPDPGADPLCVEFDKTNQNVTDLGLVEFTAQEPSRVAAAATKCFYFQRDHWTGSIVQGAQPEVWHWDGDYFFDRARGVGGVSVRNLRLGGSPASAAPFVPDAYRPFFDDQGGGGVEVLTESDPDPGCASKVDTPEERDRVYGGRGVSPGCLDPGGVIRGRRVGPARLGRTRDRVRSKLGPPSYARQRVDAWCLVGKGELRVAYTRRGRAKAIVTSGRGHSFRAVARGDRLRRALRRLDIAQRLNLREGGRLLIVADPGRRRQVWLGTRHERVRWVLVQRRGRLPAVTFAQLIRRLP
jgi:hypothetical protein